jgi:hypothetical protein
MAALVRRALTRCLQRSTVAGVLATCELSGLDYIQSKPSFLVCGYHANYEIGSKEEIAADGEIKYSTKSMRETVAGVSHMCPMNNVVGLGRRQMV